MKVEITKVEYMDCVIKIIETIEDRKVKFYADATGTPELLMGPFGTGAKAVEAGMDYVDKFFAEGGLVGTLTEVEI